MKRNILIKVLDKEVQNLSILLCVPVIVGFCGGLFWFFELFAHFRLQYFIVALLLICAALAFKNRKALLFSAFAFTVNLLAMLPYILIPSAQGNISQDISFMAFNVLTSNKNAADVKSAIVRENPE